MKNAITPIEIIRCDKNLKKLINFLLKNSMVINKKININDLKKSQSYDLVDIDGNFISRNFFIKTSIKNHNVINVGKKNIVKSIKHDIKKIKVLILKNHKSLKIKSKNANKIKLDIKKYEQKLDVELKNVNNLMLDLNKLDYYIEDSISEQVELDKLIKNINKEIDQLSIDKNSIDIKIKDLDRKKIAYKTELNDIQNQIDKIYIKRTDQEQEYQKQQIRYIERKKESENLNYRLRTNLKNRDLLMKKIKDYKNNIERMKNHNIELSTKFNNGKKAVDLLINKKQKLLNQKNKIEVEYNKEHEIFQFLQKSLLNFQKNKESQLLNIQEYQIGINDIQNNKQSILDRIKELYSVKIDKNILMDEFNIEELDKKLISFRTTFDRIGPVNMGVEDEYNEENDRLQHLMDQYDDIILSKKNLKDTIVKIDSEANNRLILTFNKISVNFTETYKMFFDGGNGKLRLIQDNEDPLDFDLEIIAQPPGKKTQTLRMLSTGEKALTAISLLFAIYLVKPSPFCILDEVDAPLDDSNVRKFSKAIRKFSEKTQFIIVTHNKLTMEKADSLYGVTNEEEGISKIVSVKINKKEKNIARA